MNPFLLTLPQALDLLNWEPDTNNRANLLYQLVQRNRITESTFRIIVTLHFEHDSSEDSVEQPGV